MNRWLPSMGLSYRAVWRWHFYAGIFCIPFVIVLAASGAVYLFKTEIEDWHDRPYDTIVYEGEPALPSQQVKAALAAIPGSTAQSYELPKLPRAAGRVLVRKGNDTLRVYLDPRELTVLASFPDENRFMRRMFRLHGELWMEDRGSNLVELASCWTIVMILTGLYLWWPRRTRGWGGVLYPRLNSGSRTFWRDCHGVFGFWLSGVLLLLLATGLPWAKHWGNYFKDIRRLTGAMSGEQDWTVGSERRSAAAGAALKNERAASDERAGGQRRAASGSSEHGEHGGGGRRGGERSMPDDLTALDRVAATATALNLPPPVIISPPRKDSPAWTVKSNTPNRPKRVDLRVHGKTGEVLTRTNFTDRHWVDQVVGTGIAFHEGRLFGWPNQLLLLLAAMGAIFLCLSAVILWWRRREPGTLGAPRPTVPARFSIGLLLIVMALAAYLPMFGYSLLAVLVLERLVLRPFPPTRRWLGLDGPVAPEGESILLTDAADSDVAQSQTPPPEDRHS